MLPEFDKPVTVVLCADGESLEERVNFASGKVHETVNLSLSRYYEAFHFEGEVLLHSPNGSWMGCVKPDGVGLIAIDADKDYSTSRIVVVSVTDV